MSFLNKFKTLFKSEEETDYEQFNPILDRIGDQLSDSRKLDYLILKSVINEREIEKFFKVGVRPSFAKQASSKWIKFEPISKDIVPIKANQVTHDQPSNGKLFDGWSLSDLELKFD